MTQNKPRARQDYTPEEAATIEQMCAERLTPAEIGAQLERSGEAIRHYLNRRGMSAGGPKDRSAVRRNVENMRPLEAVEYLLSILEDEVPPGPPPNPLASVNVDLTITERRVLLMLIERAPGIVTSAAVMRHLYLGRSIDEEPDRKIVGVFVCKLRRKTKRLPFRIITHWGQGYSLERDRGAVMPWERGPVAEKSKAWAYA